MGRTLSSELNTQHVTSKPAMPLRLLANLLQWQRRMASRHQLARLDSRLLADAGISEAQRFSELNKPFWR